LAFAEDESDVSANMKQLLDSFLGGLPSCVNRELIDQVSSSLMFFSIDFYSSYRLLKTFA
jgi:hypothetical protein